MSGKLPALSAALVLLGLLAVPQLATQESVFPGEAPGAPVSAVVEGYRSPSVNPAALAYGNARGITYARPFDSSGLGQEWQLYFNGRYLTYSLQQTPNTLLHSLSLASSPFDNFYFGTTMTTSDWNLGTARYTTGFQYRPLDVLSLGARGVFHNGTAPQSAYSAGIRPFALTGLPDRLLTAGFEVGLEKLKPDSYQLSLDSSPVDWLEFGFGYDLENGAFNASLALSFHNLKSGAAASLSGTSISAGTVFATAAPRPYTQPLKSGKDKQLHRYPLDGPIVDTRAATSMGSFHLISEGKTIWSVRRDLRRLARDPQIDGIAVVNSHPQLSLSMTLELIAALKEFKASGKTVVFYQDYMSSTDFLLAAAVGDQVYLHPGGMIDFKGLALSRPYLEQFLARFGVEIENFRSHPQKSSYNFLTESEMTDAEREAFSALLGSLQDEILRLIREGRGDRLQAPIESLVENGPYLVAEDAVQDGLVDELIRQDRFTEKLSSQGGSVTLRTRMPAEPFRRDWSDPARKKVAVINAVGPIHSGEGAPGSSIGEKTLSDAIRAARTDPTVSGILLRVNSGGGSALASEMIAREIEMTVTGENSLPLVVSMGATAASGGYYITAYADRIVAYPTTLTGSIGVIGVVPHIEDLLRQQKIAWETVKTSEQADMGAVYRDLSEAEREKLHDAIMHTYDRFVTAVSEGRNMEKAAVDEAARGRIWSGRQAAERGLVDEIGGINTALAALREEIGTEQPLELADYTYRGVFPALSLGGTSSALLELAQPDFMPAEFASLHPALSSAYLRILKGGAGYHDYTLAVMPYTFPEITGERE